MVKLLRLEFVGTDPGDAMHHLHFISAYRNHQDAAYVQLIEQGLRYRLGGCGHQYFLEWSKPGEPSHPVLEKQSNAAVSHVLKQLGCTLKQAGLSLNTVDFGPQFRQDGRLIARARTDLQDLVGGLDVEELGLVGYRKGLGYGLLTANGKGYVFVSPLFKGLVQEEMSGDFCRWQLGCGGHEYPCA